VTINQRCGFCTPYPATFSVRVRVRESDVLASICWRVWFCFAYLIYRVLLKLNLCQSTGAKRKKRKIWRGASSEDGGDLALSAIYSIVIGVIAILAFI